MTASFIITMCLLFFVIAALYSSVGHAGASGYLAIMGLMSFTHDLIKPTSLVLNIIVALIATIKFLRAGYFDKKIFLVFIITSIPLAFVGGMLTISPHYFKLCAGIFLVLSALLLLIREYIRPGTDEIRNMPVAAGLGLGGVIGVFSGLIGVGGGIFLSPIIVLARWTTVKKASGVAAFFILLNSISGLAGSYKSLGKLDASLFYWIAAVIAGGMVGTWFGTKKFNNRVIITLLFLVLLSAGLKFTLVDFFK